MRKIIEVIVIILLLSVNYVNATRQRPDLLIYKNDTLSIDYYPLAEYFDSVYHSQPHILFNKCFSTDLLSGYQAIWKIENDSIFLSKIIDGCGDVFNLHIFFPDEEKDKIFAYWINMEIIYNYGEILHYEYLSFGYGSIYEKEIGFEIENGILVRVNNYDNSKSIISEYTKDRNLLKEYILKELNVKLLKDTNLLKNCLIYAYIYSNEIGKIDSVHILQGVSKIFDSEIVRIIKNIPIWSFFYEHGKPTGNVYCIDIELCENAEWNYDIFEKNFEKFYGDKEKIKAIDKILVNKTNWNINLIYFFSFILIVIFGSFVYLMIKRKKSR
jgi:hypothetical protein